MINFVKSRSSPTTNPGSALLEVSTPVIILFFPHTLFHHGRFICFSIIIIMQASNPPSPTSPPGGDSSVRYEQLPLNSHNHDAASAAVPSGGRIIRPIIHHHHHHEQVLPLLEKPKRPLSAYNLFFRDERLRLLANPPAHLEGADRKMGLADMVRTIGSRWKTIDPETKAKYDSLGREEKVRYKKKLAEWKRLMKTQYSKTKKMAPTNSASVPSYYTTTTSTATGIDGSGFLAQPHPPVASAGGGRHSFTFSSSSSFNSTSSNISDQLQQQQQQDHRLGERAYAVAGPVPEMGYHEAPGRNRTLFSPVTVTLAATVPSKELRLCRMRHMPRSLPRLTMQTWQ